MFDLRIDIVICPKCGSPVEVFTDEFEAACGKCGRTVQREIASCIDYCPNAHRCLAEHHKRQAKLETEILVG